jgi:exopolyphosphatase/pppGpp-phosphohydrolase
MPICRALRARSSSSWRAWWVRTGASFTLERLEDLIPPWDRLAIYLIVLLRLAVLLHRGRSAVALPNIELTARGRTLELRFPARWLNEHPLTVADLQLEIELSAARRHSPARVFRRQSRG